MEALEKAQRAVDVGVEKQAADVVLLDVQAVCDFADYFVLLTAETRRQTEAVVEDIEKELGGEGATLLHREGERDSGWILLDYGDLIVHVFGPAERELYQLERLWRGAVPLVQVQ